MLWSKIWRERELKQTNRFSREGCGCFCVCAGCPGADWLDGAGCESFWPRAVEGSTDILHPQYMHAFKQTKIITCARVVDGHE